MLLSEARWLAGHLARTPRDDLGVVLNLGSSSAEFRQQVQPYIDELLFQPLAARGVPVVHTDLKAEDPGTVSADICDDRDLGRLRALRPTTVLCTNMLEHVSSLQHMASRIRALVPPRGKLIVTVPYSYPYHPDPIDTMFRPDPNQLCALFNDFEVQDAAVVEGPTLLEEMRDRPRRLVGQLGRSVLPWPNRGAWLSALHRWRWLARPYKVSCAILQRPEGAR